MVDLNDFFNGEFNFDALRDCLDDEWKKQGLKDVDLRVSYNAMLTKEQGEELFNKAVALNSQTQKLTQRGGVFVKKILKRYDERFLDLINSGLDVNFCLSENGVKFNLLNQSLKMLDYNRLTLLLSAGAKPQIDLDNPQNDSLVIAAHSGDLSAFCVVLSYLDKPIENHWLIGLLLSTNNPNEYVMGQMMARRCEQLGDNIDSLIVKSQKSFENKFLGQRIEK